jgi:MFS family permease
VTDQGLALTARPGPARRTRPTRIWTLSVVALLGSTADSFVLLLVLWLAAPLGWAGWQTALVVVGLRLPTLLCGPLAGRAVDRWGARPVIAVDLAGRAVLMMILLGFAHTGRLPLVPVLILGAISGALSPASYAGVRWLTPRLVSEDRLGRANAVVALSDQLPLLVAPALVGPALAVLGLAWSLSVPVGLLVIALVLTWRLPTAGPSVGTRRPTRSAFDAPTRAAPVVAILALSTAYYLLYGPFETASPSFVRNQLHAGNGTYSLLWTLFGAGAVATLALAAPLARRHPGRVNACGALIWGLVMLPVAFLHSAVATAAIFLAGGAVWGPYTAVETSALQRWTDPSVHGVMFGRERGLLAGAAPVGAAIGAIALPHTAPNVVLGVSAAACAAAGLLALANRDLRRAP